jgi:hypothetical protein
MHIHCFTTDSNVPFTISPENEHQLVLQWLKSRLSFEAFSQPSQLKTQPVELTS